MAQFLWYRFEMEKKKKRIGWKKKRCSRQAFFERRPRYSKCKRRIFENVFNSRTFVYAPEIFSTIRIFRLHCNCEGEESAVVYLTCVRRISYAKSSVLAVMRAHVSSQILRGQGGWTHVGDFLSVEYLRVPRRLIAFIMMILYAL
jgi:hypothetical protein